MYVLTVGCMLAIAWSILIAEELVNNIDTICMHGGRSQLLTAYFLDSRV